MPYINIGKEGQLLYPLPQLLKYGHTVESLKEMFSPDRTQQTYYFQLGSKHPGSNNIHRQMGKKDTITSLLTVDMSEVCAIVVGPKLILFKDDETSSGIYGKMEFYGPLKQQAMNIFPPRVPTPNLDLRITAKPKLEYLAKSTDSEMTSQVFMVPIFMGRSFTGCIEVSGYGVDEEGYLDHLKALQCIVS